MLSIVHKTTVSPLRVDRISMTYGCDIKVKEVMGLLSREGYAHRRHRQLYNFSLDVPLSKGSLLLQCDPWYSTNAYFRCEFNPNSCYMPDVRGVLDAVLRWGYTGLLNHGRVTRIDLAVDVGVDIDSLLISKPMTRRSGIYANEMGELETYYLGSRTSPLCFAVYDKRAEQESKGSDMPTSAGPLTRIEARLRPSTKWTLLPEEKNPFAKLLVTSYGAFGEPDAVTSLFLDSCRLRGAQMALIELKKKDKDRWKKYSKMLKQHVSPWWDPDALWEQLPSLLASLEHPAGHSELGERLRERYGGMYPDIESLKYG